LSTSAFLRYNSSIYVIPNQQVDNTWQNGYAERLMRTIKEEEVDLSEYEDDTDAVRQVGRFLDEVYMHKRIHSSLGYLTPAEFEQHWLT
jgi:putative transposase